MIRCHREFLGEVYLPVMKTLLEAPPTSPLTEIDVGNVADFIIQLTKPTGPSVRLSIALICPASTGMDYTLIDILYYDA